MINIKQYIVGVFTPLFLITQIHTEEPASLALSCPGQAHTESIIYNPERSKYSTGGSAIPTTKKDDCPFCKKLASNNDRKYLILARYKHTYIMLCEFPYLTGHLLILPLEHHASLTELSPEARNECIALLSEAITIMNNYFKPEGLNIGINAGKAAGGSVPGHMHIHILPRKPGDIAFLELIAKTNTIFTDMNKLYDDLKAKFNTLKFDEKKQLPIQAQDATKSRHRNNNPATTGTLMTQ